MDITLRNRIPASVAALLGLALAMASVSVAQANGPAGVPNANAKVSASATLHFRIVIAETLRIEGTPQRVSATAPATTRTVTFHDGRQLVTLARP
jgi:hypothetical protein